MTKELADFIDTFDDQLKKITEILSSQHNHEGAQVIIAVRIALNKTGVELAKN